MHKILICRHSTRDTQPIDCCISQEGVDIIDNKINDIKKLIPNPKHIITPPYRRTMETAQCICAHYVQHVKIITENQVEEVMFHEHQKNTIGEPLKRLLKWDIESNRSLENWDDVHKRSQIYLNSIQSSVYPWTYEESICVTHGGIINSIITLLDDTYTYDLNGTNPHAYVPNFCEYIVVEFTPTSIKLIHKSF
jgi:broad specificity phosphatase PhoE